MNRIGPKLKRVLEQSRRRKITPGLYTFDTRNYKILRSGKYETIKIQIPRVVNSLPNDNKEYINALLKNGTVMAVHPDYVPTDQWIDAQNKYISKLSPYDLETVKAYTVRSFEWIGEWFRSKNTSKVSFTVNDNKFVTPLRPQLTKILCLGPNEKVDVKTLAPHVLDEALRMYIQDLHRIIKGAPPLKTTMYVFRGIDQDVFQGKPGTHHTLDSFASAAYIPQPGYASHGYMRVKLLRGTRVLLLQGLNKWRTTGEYEVLMNLGSRYVISKRNLMRYVINNPNREARKLRVSDVTVYT